MKAGDIVLFNGTLVHAGAAYTDKGNEVHLRINFYTNSTGHNCNWHVNNTTEIAQAEA